MPRSARTLLSALLVASLSVASSAQGRTDTVTLVNGDRISGEVLRLDRGRLEFKTDNAGTLYLEWDKLRSVLTTRLVEVATADGTSYLGSLVQAPSRAISVATLVGGVALRMAEVTSITPIGRSFWRKLDGSIDAGFNYTQSSGVGQLTLNSDIGVPPSGVASAPRRLDDPDPQPRATKSVPTVHRRTCRTSAVRGRDGSCSASAASRPTRVSA